MLQPRATLQESRSRRSRVSNLGDPLAPQFYEAEVPLPVELTHIIGGAEDPALSRLFYNS